MISKHQFPPCSGAVASLYERRNRRSQTAATGTAILFFFLAVRTLAATGDIVQVLARPDGVSVDVVYEGYTSNSLDTLNHISVTNIVRNTNGTLVTNIFLRPSATTPHLKIHSPGFDSTGTSNWSLRYAWFTTHMRSNYPSQGRKDDRRDATLAFITNRYSLDMPVKIGDSVTATIGASTYSNNAAVTDFAVANNSLGTWRKPVANWIREPQIITNTSFTCEAVGFDGMADGQNWLNLNGTNRTGQPLACMKFIWRDEHNVGVTNTVAAMSIDWAYNFTAPFWNRYGEWLNVSPAGYLATITASSFTAHDQLRGDFIAYPQWGTNYFSTLDNLFSFGPRPTSLTNFYDPNDNFGTHAVVDMLNGSDANGRATNANYSSISSGHYFKTLTVAINAITGSNNLSSVVPTLHANPGGGKLWIRTSNTNGYWWTEGTLSAGSVTQAKCWFTVSTYPGDAQVIITNRNGDRNVGHWLAFNNVKFAIRDPAVPLNGIGRLWLDQCTIDSPDATATQMILASTNVYLTRDSITNWGQGIKPFANNGTRFALIRGCDLDGDRVSGSFNTQVGNVHPSTNRTGFAEFDWTSSNATEPPVGILYCNYLGGMTPASALSIGGATHTSNGVAVVNNVIEGNNTANQALASMGSSGNFHQTNYVIWHNAFVGERIADWASSASETATIYREDWSQHGNIADLVGFKKDYDGTQDEDRFFGAPGVLFMCNGTGNYWREARVNSAAGGFPPDFDGFYSSWPHYNLGLSNIMNSASFTYLNSAFGDGVAKAGGSDLRTQISPIQGMAGRWVLPFDILGRSTGKTRKPGPYSESALEKGVF